MVKTRAISDYSFQGRKESRTEIIYSEATAAKLEEFRVVKINQHGTKQKRLLGIDVHNIYNNVIGDEKSVLNFFTSESKRPKRGLKEIADFGCDYEDNKQFFIVFWEEKKEKKLLFEAETIQDKIRILAKLNYLTKRKV